MLLLSLKPVEPFETVIESRNDETCRQKSPNAAMIIKQYYSRVRKCSNLAHGDSLEGEMKGYCGLATASGSTDRYHEDDISQGYLRIVSLRLCALVMIEFLTTVVTIVPADQ